MGQLLARLAAIDVRLSLDGDRLNVNAPKGALNAELRAELGAAKEALKAHLRAHPQASASQPVTLPALVPVPRRPSMPVSHTQQRMWFLRQMDPHSGAYNISTAFHARGPLDAAALERSFGDLVKRHESLRMSFHSVDGVPHCTVHPEASLVSERLDLSAEADAEQRATALALAATKQPFDLRQAPLLRLSIIKIAPAHHLCCFVVDHIVADGISVSMLFAELLPLYAQHTGGQPAELVPHSVDFLDCVAWQEQLLASGVLAEQLRYWTDQLRGLPPVLPLPTDRPRPRLQSSRGARRLEIFPADLMHELKALARAEGVTLYMVLMAGLQILLHRYTREEDFAIGTVVAARDVDHAQRIVGFFANNIVIRADVSGRPVGREVLRRVRETALQAYAHQQMPFDVLVDALVRRRDLDHSPLFQVMLVVHTHAVSASVLGPVRCELQELQTDTSRFDLAIDVFDLSEGTRVYFEYNTDLFDGDTIGRMMGHYRNVLAGLAATPDAPIDRIRLLDPGELQGRAVRQRGETLPAIDEESVHALVEAVVARCPDATAVLFEGRRLTYGELDRRANQLARHLAGLGTGPGALVGVYLERSLDMVVALLAVWKAGAAYVPLDPAFPIDRLTFMMRDAALAAVVSSASLASALPAGSPLTLCMDTDAGLIAGHDCEPLEVAVTAGDLAYTIYTSGSTGRPKGVQIEHGSVVNFLRAMHRCPGLSADDCLVSVTTLSFDIAGLEIWGPLTAGGVVVLASRATALDGERLGALLDASRATILQATPATWRLLLESGWPGRAGLRMLCGGEALPRELAERLLALPGELWNMYGPTETTIWSTVHRVVDASRPIAIGEPIAETSIHVLEPSGLSAPLGVPGELCIGGRGVARGYLGRDDLTADRFVTIAVDDAPPERVYRTGDLVRWRNDGQLEFLGRRDHQVKIRGFRIELEEIEAVLAAVPGVRQCVAAVREDVPGDQRLVAYVVSEGAAGFEREQARARLRLVLPEYMVPNLFVVLDALPLTPNGKVDRRNLPPPSPEAPEPQAPEPLMTGPQQRVAAIWKDLLGGLPRVGLRDNFFDLGGHSLLLAQLQARLQREFGADLPLVELFQCTTVAAQAARLTTTSTDDGALRRARERARRQAHD